MLTAKDVLSRIRPMLKAVVERERRYAGSLMLAYKRVAEKIGASDAWIQRVLGRRPSTVVQGHQVLNIMALFKKAHSRRALEAEAQAQDAMIARLWGQHADLLDEVGSP